MTPATLDKCIWPLIYGGVLLLLLGVATLAADAPLGWAIAMAGAVLTALGMLGIYLRSRMPD